MEGSMRMAGRATLRVTRARQAPAAWRLRNMLRPGYVGGWIATRLAKVLTALTGVPTITSELAVRVRTARGEWIDYGVVSRRVVTNAGVAAIVDAFQNSVELEAFNYHGIGTGNTAEDAGDTALVSESTTALNPDNTRATGTQSEPASNQYRTTGTLTADNTIAAVEHGLFSQAATGGGTLFDRSVFSVINLASGDSLQTQYTVTFNAGG